MPLIETMRSLTWIIDAAAASVLVALSSIPSIRMQDKSALNSGRICFTQHPIGLPSVYTTGSNFKCNGPGGNSITYSDGAINSGTSVDVELTARDVPVVELDWTDDVLGDIDAADSGEFVDISCDAGGVVGGEDCSAIAALSSGVPGVGEEAAILAYVNFCVWDESNCRRTTPGVATVLGTSGELKS